MNHYTCLIFTVIQILIHLLLFIATFLLLPWYTNMCCLWVILTHSEEDQKMDPQGKHISRACENHHLVIMNDSSPMFLSSSNVSSSIIDLSIASRSLALFVNQETIQDPYDSDHYPVRITIRNIHPSVYWYSYKHRFSFSQLSLIHDHLVLNAPKFREELFSTSYTQPNPKIRAVLFAS